MTIEAQDFARPVRAPRTGEALCFARSSAMLVEATARHAPDAIPYAPGLPTHLEGAVAERLLTCVLGRVRTPR